MNIERIYQLIAKQKGNSISVDELNELNKLKCEDNNQQAEYNKAEQTWAYMAQYTQNSYNTDAAWGKVKSSIQQQALKRKRRVLLQVAAAIVIGVSLFYLLVRQPGNTAMVMVKQADSIQNINLNDGSQITINKSTTLSYAAQLPMNQRNVSLISGEAYFNVKHHKNKPFMVNTPGARIKVLGTKFNVIYTNEGYTQVTVVSGKVQVSQMHNNQRCIYLSGNQRCTIMSDSIITENNVSDNFLAWKNRHFTYANVSLETVLREIEKVYGVQVKVTNDDIYNLKLTSTFDNQSAIQIINTIATVFNLSLHSKNNVYTLAYKN